jgi:Transcriptional regulator PadR-like family
MTESKQELLRGTLDMLVLKIVALGPSHGYAIAQRLPQISTEFFQVHQGHSAKSGRSAPDLALSWYTLVHKTQAQ